MALEDLTGTAKYINSLVITNPDGAVDPKSQGDDHIRGVKNVIKNTFPNITGPVTADHTELNKLDGVTLTTAQINATYFVGGTDVAVADGGTGASTAADARTNLGLGALAVKNTVASADIDAEAISNDKLKTASAGEVVGGSSNLTLSTASTTYVKTIEFFILRSGTYRVAFDLAENPEVASNLAYARVYRNGVAVGTERTDNDTTPTSFTEDISGWTEGDLLQIYQRVDIASSASKVTNLKIKASFFVFVPLSTHFTPVT